MDQDYIAKQLSVCQRLGQKYVSSETDLKVGVSRNILDGSWLWPVQGLRHQSEQGATIERPFGWVFSVVLDDTNPSKRQPMIVNKYVHQIVASSVELRPAELGQIYESLLAQNRVNANEWCLTLSSDIPLRDWRFRRTMEKGNRDRIV